MCRWSQCSSSWSLSVDFRSGPSNILKIPGTIPLSLVSSDACQSRWAVTGQMVSVGSGHAMSQQLRFQLRLRIPGVLKSGPNPTDSRWGDGVAFFFLQSLGSLGWLGFLRDVWGFSGGWFADRTQWGILCQHVTSRNFWLPMRKISLVKIQSQLYEDRILMDFWAWFIWSGFEWNLKGRTGRILRLAEAGWKAVGGTTWLIATAWLLPNTWPRAQGSRTDSHRVAGCEIGKFTVVLFGCPTILGSSSVWVFFVPAVLEDHTHQNTTWIHVILPDLEVWKLPKSFLNGSWGSWPLGAQSIAGILAMISRLTTLRSGQHQSGSTGCHSGLFLGLG